MNHWTRAQLTLVTAALLPVLAGIRSGLSAAVIAGSALSAVFVFEILHLIVRRFLMRSLIFVFAMMVIAPILAALALLAETYLSGSIARQEEFFVLAFPSAFVLVHGTTLGLSHFRDRTRIWLMYLMFAVIIGFLREFGGPFGAVEAVPYWILGLMFGGWMYFNRRTLS